MNDGRYRNRFLTRQQAEKDSATARQTGGGAPDIIHSQTRADMTGATAAAVWGQGRAAADADTARTACPFTGALLSRLWIGGWCERQLERLAAEKKAPALKEDLSGDHSAFQDDARLFGPEPNAHPGTGTTTSSESSGQL